jgi:ribosomal protein L29
MVLGADEIKKMDLKTRKEKYNELKLELVKSGIKAHKASTKTKEIKKALARILTITHAEAKSAEKS